MISRTEEGRERASEQERERERERERKGVHVAYITPARSSLARLLCLIHDQRKNIKKQVRIEPKKRNKIQCKWLCVLEHAARRWFLTECCPV